jgi:uncharacterized protein (DUF1697 family)
MPRFVALLRGVNVGKANRIAMEAFRRLLQDLGFSDVRTLLNSGNAVFTSTARSPDAHARAIETALQEGFGLSIQVVVKSASAFEAAVAGNPIVPQAEDHSQFLVAFSQESQCLERLSLLTSLVQPPERFHIGKHAAYLHCARGMLKSKAASALLGKAGHGVTTRNWATVLKLNDLLHESRV